MIYASSLAQVNEECFPFRLKKCGEHEIGVNLYSMSNFSSVPRGFSEDKISVKHNFLNGLLYKLHCGKNALRVGVGYNYNNIRIENIGEMYYYKDFGQRHTASFNIGYERKFLLKKIQPFIAADIVYTHSCGQGVQEYYADFSRSPQAEYNMRNNEIGIASIIGIKYRYNDRFSVSAETSFYVAYGNSSRHYDEYILDYYNNQPDYFTNYQIDDRGLKRSINPIARLTFNYHFIR